MAYSVKSSLLAWWLILIIAVFLWYRNTGYDRIFAAIAIVVAMIQLIEYGIYNNMNPYQGGRMVFLVIWLISFILALTVLIYVKNIYALLWLIIISIIFLFSVIFVFFTKDDQKFKVVNDSGYLIYNFNNMGLIFILTLIVPIILLLSYYGWKDYGLYAVIIYLILSALVIISYLGYDKFPSVWCYSFVGVIFIVWFAGMFSP